ncbi:MAG: tRNA (adenosine(37)-N6)-threonylcarbamoyltransferase complex transferase subunit TsaD [Cyanobacteria bacterium P01_D01_bin.105]
MTANILSSTVIAIETSCDETAVAIVRKSQSGIEVLSSVVASQIETHRQYGGVVPEVASREHVRAIGHAIAQALTDSNLVWADIDAVAATCAPGLVGALMVGITAAKTLAIIHSKPFIGVHHLEGHIYASYLTEPDLTPPFLCLLVSGGHTSFVHVRASGDYAILGKTRDDAAGEAFDKVARLLNLGYPGGPVIDKLAQSGNSKAFSLPEGKISLPGGGFHPYDASFSGLKTAVLRLKEKLLEQGYEEQGYEEQVPKNQGAEFPGKSSNPLPAADIAASFQATVVRALVKRAIACATDHALSTIVVGGGVAANSALRQQLQLAAAAHRLTVTFPPMKYCTDNAAMIACAALDHYEKGERSPLTLGAQSKLAITDIHGLYAAVDPDG